MILLIKNNINQNKNMIWKSILNNKKKKDFTIKINY